MMTTLGSDGWTDARINTLKDLWSQGLAASQIMTEFCHDGFSVTRSAILGKISRLKLPPRDAKVLGGQQIKSPPKPYHRAERSPARVPSQSRPREPASLPAETPLRRPIENLRAAEEFAARRAVGNVARLPSFSVADDERLSAELDEPAAGKGLSLVELENCHCRWPFGDPLTPNFYFCGALGADMSARKPYCDFHERKSENREAMRRVRGFESSAIYAARR